MGQESLCHYIQTDSGTNPATYPVGTGGTSPGTERSKRESSHSPSSSADVTNAWCGVDKRRTYFCTLVWSIYNITIRTDRHSMNAPSVLEAGSSYTELK